MATLLQQTATSFGIIVYLYDWSVGRGFNGRHSPTAALAEHFCLGPGDRQCHGTRTDRESSV